MSEQPIKIEPRQERKYNLTPLGHQAVKWIIEQERKALEAQQKKK